MRRLAASLFVPVVLVFAPAFALAQSATDSPSATATRPRTVTIIPALPRGQSPVTAPTPAAPPRAQESAPASPQTASPMPGAENAPATVVPSAPAITTAPAATVPAAVAPPATPPAAVLPPSRLLPASRVSSSLVEARRILRARVTPTAMSATPNLFFVTLTAYEPHTSRIHLLSLPKSTFLTRDADVSMTTSLGLPVRVRILRPNYVNTAVHIFEQGTGRALAPLIVEYPIERAGRFAEMAYYVSAHPALLSPEVVHAGKNYVRTMLDEAAQRLRAKGVMIDRRIIDVAERLVVVEHVDHTRFLRENRRLLYDEIYSLFALNEGDTYRYSVSWAGAGGMVQMIPSTYLMVRQRHAAVGLQPDFVAGMRNHNNALEAMLLYMRDTWLDLSSNQEVRYALGAGIATQPELMAAGYNSNPARLPGYLRRGGTAWRTLIPRETQMYLQIYASVESLVPMTPRTQ